MKLSDISVKVESFRKWKTVSWVLFATFNYKKNNVLFKTLKAYNVVSF